MDIAITVLQLTIALTILNVWLLRFDRATEFRGGDARNMTEEFAVYGLPVWSVPVIGVLKIVCAVGLIAGVWIPGWTLPSAVGLGVLMLGAVSMHMKVGDSIKKTAPAFTLFLLCLLVAFV